VIELSDLAAMMLERGNQKRYVRIESWLDDDLLSDDVPVIAAREEVDRSNNVPERLSFSVPRTAAGFDWTPTTDTHPLAANGQRVRVLLGVGTGLDAEGAPRVEWLNRGWFVIYSAEANGDQVDVEAYGLLWLVQEARLVSPYQPAASSTFRSVLRDLMGPGVPAVFDGALINRTVPSTINYDDDRLGAVYATLAAWPAEGQVTEDGYFLVSPAADASVVSLALTDGRGGTVVRAAGVSTREGAYNAVVARGTAADGGQVQGVAYDTGGPKRVGGPFNDLPVPYYYDSPLLTTQAQAQAAAKTRLATIKRQTSSTYTVEMVPHPALQTGDLVTLTTEHFTALPAIVEALVLPYNPDGGSQTLTVRSTT